MRMTKLPEPESHSSEGEDCVAGVLAERRAWHNSVERVRREALNAKFTDLAQQLPSLAHIHRPSKSVIISHCLDMVTDLRDLTAENKSLKEEIEHLRTCLQHQTNERAFPAKFGASNELENVTMSPRRTVSPAQDSRTTSGKSSPREQSVPTRRAEYTHDQFNDLRTAHMGHRQEHDVRNLCKPEEMDTTWFAQQSGTQIPCLSAIYSTTPSDNTELSLNANDLNSYYGDPSNMAGHAPYYAMPCLGYACGPMVDQESQFSQGLGRATYPQLSGYSYEQ